MKKSIRLYRITMNTKPMAERIEFHIIADRDGDRYEVWSDGDSVNWKCGDRRGTMPRPLFLIAAQSLVGRCEDVACGGALDDDCDMLNVAFDHMMMPSEVAMSWDDVGDPDDFDTSNFGFTGIAASTAIDGKPHRPGER